MAMTGNTVATGARSPRRGRPAWSPTTPAWPACWRSAAAWPWRSPPSLAAVDAGPAGHPALLARWVRGLASLVALVGIVVAGWLVALLRQAYSDPAKRKSIGALWDVGTWAPGRAPTGPALLRRAGRARGRRPDPAADRAYHHQAGRRGLPSRPSRAAEPERTRRLTVPPGPLLLTGYSQGAVIAPAVIAQLPEDVLPDVALLTLACPARRLYGRAFPAYLGPPQLTELARLLDARAPGESPAPSQPAGRWKNLRRRSDYIGSWIFAEPLPRLSDADLHHHIDQPCWDPRHPRPGRQPHPAAHPPPLPMVARPAHQ